MKKKIKSSSKIVIITNYPFPGSAATANRVSSLATEIVTSSAFEVVVVGPRPLKTKRIKEAEKSRIYRIISVHTSPYSKTNLFLRALGELKQTQNLLKTAYKENADLYIVTIPSLFLILAVVFFRSKPIIFDFRDLVWEYLIELGGVKSLAGKFVKLMLPFLLRQSRAITVTNSIEKKELGQLTKGPITIVSNGVSKFRFSKLSSIGQATASIPYKVLYVGNLGMAQNLETLLEAVGGDERFEICFIGDGVKAKFLKDIVRNENMKNVEFTGNLEWLDTLAYIEKANCVYGQISKSFTSAIPSKLFEYLSCGRPVVFGLPDGAAKSLAYNFKDIYIIPPETPDELRETLLELMRDQKNSCSSAKFNRKKIQQFYLREDNLKNFNKVVKLVTQKNLER